jgi:GR25 family glycosyltransferase involved in LPS biosynthesis
MELLKSKTTITDRRWKKWEEWFSQNTKFLEPVEGIEEEFENIDHVYVITLPKREANVRKAIKKLNRKVSIFSAIPKDKINEKETKQVFGVINHGLSFSKRGPIACALSHYAIMVHSLKNKYKKIMVFEDDLDLSNIDDGTSEWFDDAESQIEAFLAKNKVPPTFKMMNFYGYCYEPEGCKDNTINKEKTIKSMCQPFCAHAYTINEQAMRHFLRLAIPLNGVCDHLFASEVRKGNVYSFGPVPDHEKLINQDRKTHGTTLQNHDNLKTVYKKFGKNFPVWKRSPENIMKLTNELDIERDSDGSNVTLIVIASLALGLSVAFLIYLLIQLFSKKRRKSSKKSKKTKNNKTKLKSKSRR